MAPATKTSIDLIAKAEEELAALNEELRGYKARGLKERIKLVEGIIKAKTKALNDLRAELEPSDQSDAEPVDDADAEADELAEREQSDDLERAVPDPDELETR